MFGQSASATSLHSINEQIRLDPQAKKLYQGYKIKIIGGTIVGSSGVLVLNHSLGSISNRNPHDWGVTSLGVGLVGAGLLISKGAKKKRAKALQIVQQKNKVSLSLQPTGLRLSFN
ncbi:MAG: hypothetical protein ACPG7X_07890 [Flavobacteriaceae bacterium]